MQQLVYRCDECKEIIGNQPHLSLVFSGNLACGVAIPLEREGSKVWYVAKVKDTFIHLHPKCVNRYFGAMVKNAVQRNKKACHE